MTDKMIRYSYIVISALISSVCLCFSWISYARKKPFEWVTPLYLLVGFLVITLIGLAFTNRKDGQNGLEKKDRAIVFSVSILYCAFLIVATHSYYFKTGWDAGYVIGAAEAMAAGKIFEGAGYFSIYPNNLMLAGIFSLVIRLNNLFGIIPSYYSLIAFQVFFLVLSGVLVFEISFDISKKRVVAYLSWILYLLVGGLSPWVIIPYSDTVGLFFSAVILYLYTKRKCPFFVSLLLMLGYFVKPGVMILGIAIADVNIPGSVKKLRAKNKKMVCRILEAVLGLICGIAIFKGLVLLSGYHIDSDRTFGVTHYLMMGLNEEYNGVINLEDQDFSMNIMTADERKSENLRVAGERLKRFSFLGIMRHFGRKLLTSYNDGTFAWYAEGDFVTEPIWTGHPEMEMFFRAFYYPDGNAYQVFLNFSQCLWIGVLAFGMIGGFFGKDEREMVIMLTLIGAFLYEMLFEPRARHMLVYLPMFVYMAAIGANGLLSKIKKCEKKLGRTSGNAVIS